MPFLYSNIVDPAAVARGEEAPSTEFSINASGGWFQIPTMEQLIQTPMSTAQLAAEGFNEGLAGLFGRMDKAVDYLSEMTGVPKGGIINSAAKTARENADYWRARAKENGVGAIQEFIAKAVGGAAPGIASFIIDKAVAGLVGAQEAKESNAPYEDQPLYAQAAGVKTTPPQTDPLQAFIIKQMERMALGGVFHQLGQVTRPARMTATGGIFAGQAAAGGGTAKEIGESGITGVAYGRMGGPGRVSAKDVARQYMKEGGKLGERGSFGGEIGADTAGIRDKVKWFEGVYDKKPRFEIDDSRSRINEKLMSEKDQGEWEGSLFEFLSHKQLFSAYPKLRDVKIKVITDYDAYGDDAYGEISWNKKNKRFEMVVGGSDSDSIRSAILHETTHIIQKTEGFARGGHPDVDKNYLRLAGELEAWEVQSRMRMGQKNRESNPPFKGVDPSWAVVKLEGGELGKKGSIRIERAGQPKGEFYAPEGKVDEIVFGPGLRKDAITDAGEEKIFRGNSSWEFVKDNVKGSDTHPILKKYGIKDWDDFFEGTKIDKFDMNPSDQYSSSHLVTQTAARDILKKQGYPGAEWKNEDALNAVQYQVWDRSILGSEAKNELVKPESKYRPIISTVDPAGKISPFTNDPIRNMESVQEGKRPVGIIENTPLSEVKKMVENYPDIGVVEGRDGNIFVFDKRRGEEAEKIIKKLSYEFSHNTPSLESGKRIGKLLGYSEADVKVWEKDPKTIEWIRRVGRLEKDRPDELQRTYDHPARVKGLDVASEAEAKNYFKQLGEAAKGDPKIDEMVLKAEGAYERGEYEKATQWAEEAQTRMHGKARDEQTNMWLKSATKEEVEQFKKDGGTVPNTIVKNPWDMTPKELEVAASTGKIFPFGGPKGDIEAVQDGRKLLATGESARLASSPDIVIKKVKMSGSKKPVEIAYRKDRGVEAEERIKQIQELEGKSLPLGQEDVEYGRLMDYSENDVAHYYKGIKDREEKSNSTTLNMGLPERKESPILQEISPQFQGRLKEVLGNEYDTWVNHSMRDEGEWGQALLWLDKYSNVASGKAGPLELRRLKNQSIQVLEKAIQVKRMFPGGEGIPTEKLKFMLEKLKGAKESKDIIPIVDSMASMQHKTGGLIDLAYGLAWGKGEKDVVRGVLDNLAGKEDHGTTFGAGLGAGQDILTDLFRWLSPTANTIKAKGEAVMPAEEWAKRVEAWGTKNPHMRDENQWNGIMAWLEGKKGEKVKKEDVLGFLELGKGKWAVREQTHGDLSSQDIGRMEQLEKKFEDGGWKVGSLSKEEEGEFRQLRDRYSFNKQDDPWASRNIPGGIPGTEKVYTLSLPTEDPMGPPYQAARQRAREDYESGKLSRHKYDDRLVEIDDIASAKRSKEYSSPHFPDKPNVILHFRTQDRLDSQGRKGILAETIQSDWHQGSEPDGIARELRFLEVRKEAGQATPKEYEEMKHGLEEMRERTKSKQPRAPFEHTWAETGLKHLIDIAAQDPSVEWVGWTGGKVQNKRWGKDNMEEVEVSPKAQDKLDALYTEFIKDGSTMTDAEYKKRSYTIVNEDRGDSGGFLTVLYDKRLPKFAKKYAAKMGGRYNEEELSVHPNREFEVYKGGGNKWEIYEKEMLHKDAERVKKHVGDWTPDQIRKNLGEDVYFKFIKETQKPVKPVENIQQKIAQLTKELRQTEEAYNKRKNQKPPWSGYTLIEEQNYNWRGSRAEKTNWFVSEIRRIEGKIYELKNPVSMWEFSVPSRNAVEASIHRVDLTPVMKHKVNTEGQEFYDVAGIVAGSIAASIAAAQDQKKKGVQQNAN